MDLSPFPPPLEWLLADHEGSIRDVAEHNSTTHQTTVVNHLVYDAFGNITSQTNSAKQPDHTYTGQFLDPDAGLYYYRARWYDARVGRFLSEDPRGFAAGDPNLQRYVGNSPLMHTDPTGLTTQCTCGEVGAYPYNPSTPSWWDNFVKFWKDYWYYTWNRSQMDPDLQGWDEVGETMIVIGVGGLTIYGLYIWAGGATFTLAYGNGHFIFAVTVDGVETAAHAWVIDGALVVTQGGAAYLLENAAWTFAGIPILFPEAALGVVAFPYFWPCFMTAMSALWAGCGGFLLPLF